MNPFKLNSQNFRLLEALKQGPITTTQIVIGLFIFNHTRRISDLREKGFIVIAKPISNGLWEYSLLTKAQPDKIIENKPYWFIGGFKR